jgi:hypothetical protein
VSDQWPAQGITLRIVPVHAGRRKTRNHGQQPISPALHCLQQPRVFRIILERNAQLPNRGINPRARSPCGSASPCGWILFSVYDIARLPFIGIDPAGSLKKKRNARRGFEFATLSLSVSHGTV